MLLDHNKAWAFAPENGIHFTAKGVFVVVVHAEQTFYPPTSARPGSRCDAGLSQFFVTRFAPHEGEGENAQ